MKMRKSYIILNEGHGFNCLAHKLSKVKLEFTLSCRKVEWRIAPNKAKQGGDLL